MMQLNNYEKMALTIPSTANEWPQIDDQNLMASTNMGVDKPTQEQIQQQQQQAQKCPRCDSSNTKFCYYNNYSLSQPRHFCKACKRYWTRGGTLRNVPVGGGCRKNKRVKRPAAAGTTSMALDSSSVNISSSSTPMATIKPNNSLFYHGLQHSSMNPNSSELNLSFDSRIEGAAGHHLYEYDLQPQMGSLGFPSSGHIVSNSDLLSRSMLSSYHHLPNYGSLNSSLSATPTMASLLSSNLPQQRYVSNGVSGDARSGGGNFHGFSHYEGHMQGSHNDHDGGSSMKVLRKEESDHNRSNNQIQQLGSSDPNSIFWNANGGGSWHDPANSIGSSVPSLI